MEPLSYIALLVILFKYLNDAPKLYRRTVYDSALSDVAFDQCDLLILFAYIQHVALDLLDSESLACFYTHVSADDRSVRRNYDRIDNPVKLYRLHELHPLVTLDSVEEVVILRMRFQFRYVARDETFLHFVLLYWFCLCCDRIYMLTGKVSKIKDKFPGKVKIFNQAFVMYYQR